MLRSQYQGVRCIVRVKVGIRVRVRVRWGYGEGELLIISPPARELG